METPHRWGVGNTGDIWQVRNKTFGKELFRLTGITEVHHHYTPFERFFNCRSPKSTVQEPFSGRRSGRRQKALFGGIEGVLLGTIRYWATGACRVLDLLFGCHPCYNPFLGPMIKPCVKLNVTRKVIAYITRGDELLVFRQPDFPEAGLKVPGGTVESTENLKAAVIREAVEETGLQGLEIVSYLGNSLWQQAAGDLHFRYTYQLRLIQEAPDSWQHHEMIPSNGEAPILFDFFWLKLDDPRLELHAGLDHWLHKLSVASEGVRSIDRVRGDRQLLGSRS